MRLLTLLLGHLVLLLLLPLLLPILYLYVLLRLTTSTPQSGG